MIRFSGRKTLSPMVEFLEDRELLSFVPTAVAELHFSTRHKSGAVAVAKVPVHKFVSVNEASLSATTQPATGTFIDPTTVIRGVRRVTIGSQDYVGPFVSLTAMNGGIISMGNGSNVADNVAITAIGQRASVTIGDQVIVAHNATVKGPAAIGAPGGAPTFVGFNAIIDGATVEAGAMVSGLAKVAPGIVIHTGFNVLPGMYIQTQAQADDTSLGKVVPVTLADILSLYNVLHVNQILAAGYAKQTVLSPKSVRGVGPSPPLPPSQPGPSTPVLAGVPTTAPAFRDRIIGDAWMTNSLRQLDRIMGRDDSIRADEASPFFIGKIARMANRVTIHGLESTNLVSGRGDTFGFHSVIHGGSDSGTDLEATTVLGSGVRIGAWDTIFRSQIGNNCVIRPYAYIEASQLAPGTVVPRGAIIIDNQYLWRVQWI
jgi:carbonic anhydrase/acetyltransferase-like protein (isoleucine patch superfamily)